MSAESSKPVAPQERKLTAMDDFHRDPLTPQAGLHAEGTELRPATSDLHIEELDPIPAPKRYLEKYPLSAEMSNLVTDSREAIRRVLAGSDDRLLVIIGPCSIHDPAAAAEYAQKLAAKAAELNEDLLIVMRVYFEKPRTTVGWKGLIYDPQIDGSFDMRTGLKLARKVLISILEAGVPIATEFLDTITPQYISDAVSWGAIGARNPESQVHRQLVSGLSMPVGFKNTSDGRVQAAVEGVITANNHHSFLSVNFEGRIIAAKTLGNPDCHVILRGSLDGPNYYAEDVANAVAIARNLKAGAASEHGVLLDAAHGNSNKSEVREAEVVREIADRIAAGEEGITGLMIESNLKGGKQTEGPLATLEYGQSITDACVAWPASADLLDDLAAAVRTRRSGR